MIAAELRLQKKQNNKKRKERRRTEKQNKTVFTRPSFMHLIGRQLWTGEQKLIFVWLPFSFHKLLQNPLLNPIEFVPFHNFQRILVKSHGEFKENVIISGLPEEIFFFFSFSFLYKKSRRGKYFLWISRVSKTWLIWKKVGTWMN